MFGYERFKVEALRDHTAYRVLVWSESGSWESGYVFTDYFSKSYKSELAAKDAIWRYKNRFTGEL